MTDSPNRPTSPDDGPVPSPLPTVSDTDRVRIRLGILLALAVGGAYAIGALLAPFLLALVLAAVLATLAEPVHGVLRDKIGQPSVAALLTTVGIFVVVLIPLFTLGVLLVNGIESGIGVVVDRIDEFTSRQGSAWNWLASTARLVGLDEQELATAVQGQVSRAGDLLAGGTFGLLSGLGGWLAQGAIGLFTLFYLLRDGDVFVRVVRWIIPLEDALTDALISKTREVVSATVLGTLVVAAVQGTLGGLLFWALGLPAPALWGSVMGFFSLLPAIGPPVVWVPAAVILLASGQILRASILIGFGLLVIGTVDNVLRAVLVGQRAQLHSLVVFFSVLGGVVVLGTAGFLLGPILFVVAFSVLESARLALGGREASASRPDAGALLEEITVSRGGQSRPSPATSGGGPEARP